MNQHAFTYGLKLNAARIAKWRAEGKPPPADDTPF